VTRGLAIVVVIACCIAAILAASRAQATTGLEITIPVRITLTDKGVTFSHKLRPTTDTTIAARVVNRSSKPRWFKLAWRKTHTLQRGGSEVLYFSFRVAGKTKWSSGAAGGKTFRGAFTVRFVPYGAG
jgi:hypothetical protein